MADYVTFVRILQTNQLNLYLMNVHKLTHCNSLQGAVSFNLRVGYLFLRVELPERRVGVLPP